MPTIVRFGGGGAAEGNAVQDDVLSGKTFSSSNGTNLMGKMADNGSWQASVAAGSSVAVPAGYHNGNGVVTATGEATGSYQKGYTAGKEDANKTENTESASYKKGYTDGTEKGHKDVTDNPTAYNLVKSDDSDAQYNAGVEYADSRLNKESTSYTTGYSDGRLQGQTDVTSNPNNYTLYSNDQYTSYGQSRYEAGKQDGITEGKSGMYTQSQYDANYTKGVRDADNRTNTSSASYSAGYTAGKAAGTTTGYTYAQLLEYGNQRYNAGKAAGTTTVNKTTGTHKFEIHFNSSDYMNVHVKMDGSEIFHQNLDTGEHNYGPWYVDVTNS